MADIKILIATHKGCPMPKSDIFLPIQVGKKNSTIELDIQGDDEGDNISEKNPSYCELTAYYWAWKNLKTDIIGINHYRRYFDLRPFTFSMDVKNITQDDLINHIPQPARISKLLSKNDVILAKRIVSPFSMYIYYSAFHVIEDLELLTDVIKTVHPEYISTWNKFLNDKNKFSAYNMLICRKPIFDDYCEWLFSLLIEVEKRIRISPHPYNQRVFGFMAERLLNLYCFHNNLKIKYKPILFIEESTEKSKIAENVDILYSYLGAKLSNLSFFIGNHAKRYIQIKIFFKKTFS